MNIKQQIEQVIAEMRKDIDSLGWYSVDEGVLNKRIDSLSAIVEQMEADEQAIVEEVNKRWPQGKPQPDDTFVGDRTFAVAGTDEVYTEYGDAPQVTDKGPWTPSDDGRHIQSEDFEHDVTLRVSGDFATDEDRIAYTKWLAAKLNAAPQVPDGMVPAQTVLEWMEEAKEDIQDWACYASEYFREKHNLAADLVKMDMRIAVLKRMLIAARAAMGAPDRDAPDWIS